MGYSSVQFLKKYKLKYSKVASAMINRNFAEIAKQKIYFYKHWYCTFKDIDVAVKIFKNINVNLSYALHIRLSVSR